MSAIRLKVCGMKYPENIKEIAGFGPDYMGFIFYIKSPRYIGKYIDPDIIRNLPQTIKKVGVFVNETLEVIFEKVDKYNLDYVQLHGDEKVGFCQQIKERGIGVIKAISIGKVEDIKHTENFNGAVDFFLFDTHGENYGGNGKKFDWSFLEHYKLEIPFFLSGGINPEDINDIIHLQHPLLKVLDINSGFEIVPGLKNENLVENVIKQLRD